MEFTARRIGPVNWIGLWSFYCRDMSRYFNIWRITMLAPAVQMVLFLFAFRLALGDAERAMGGMAFEHFLIPGLVAYAAIQRGFDTTAFMILFDKMERVIDDISMVPLQPGELVFGYAASAASTGLITGMAAWLAILPLGGMLPVHPLAMLGFAAASAVMLGLLGVISGLWADRWEHINAVHIFIVMPTLLISGVFFSPDQLPDAFAWVASVNPAHYAIEGFRYAMTGVSVVDPGFGIAVVLATSAALWVICWRMFASGYKLKS